MRAKPAVAERGRWFCAHLATGRPFPKGRAGWDSPRPTSRRSVFQAIFKTNLSFRPVACTQSQVHMRPQVLRGLSRRMHVPPCLNHHMFFTLLLAARSCVFSRAHPWAAPRGSKLFFLKARSRCMYAKKIVF